MDGDHYNDEEIDVQRALDDDYDSGTDGSEYSWGKSDSEEDVINEEDSELLRVYTRQNYDKQSSFWKSDVICY